MGPLGCASQPERSSNSWPAECANGFSIPAASTTQSRHGSQNRRLSSGLSRALRRPGCSCPNCRRRDGTHAVLTALIERVEVRVDQVDIHLRSTGLTALFNVAVPSQSMLGFA